MMYTTFEDLSNKISDLISKIESSQASEKSEDAVEAIADVLKSVGEEIKEKLVELDEKVRVYETMDQTLARKVALAWRDHLSKVVDVSGVPVGEDDSVEKIIETLASIEIPSADELAEENEALKEENKSLKEEIERRDREALAEARFKDLIDSGIVVPESRVEKVKSLIATMDEEAFADYKQEKLDFIEAAKAAKSTEDDDEDADDTDSDEEEDRGYVATASYRRRLVVGGSTGDDEISSKIRSLFEDGE